MGAGTSAASAAGVVTALASREMDITMGGGEWSVPLLAGDAWRESIDSGALRPPCLSRGSCGLWSPNMRRCSSRDTVVIRGGGPELERRGRDVKSSGGETGLLVLAPLSYHVGMAVMATSWRRRLNGKKRRAPGEPSGSSVGPDPHELSVFGMSSDDLGSSESTTAFLKVDLRRVAKSLKSTVLERIGRRILGWRERVEPPKAVPLPNQLLLRARDSSDGCTGSRELLASEGSEGGEKAAETFA